MYDRSKTIGASDAVYIETGQWAELFDRKHGLDEAESPLAAEIGKRLEVYNLELFAAATGFTVTRSPIWSDQPFRMSVGNDADGHDWCTYTPDGLVDLGTMAAMVPIEAKCVNMMWTPVNLLAKYMPQLQHGMRVISRDHCYFSVIYLNTRYEWTEVWYDPIYDNALFEKEQLFMWFLENDKRPPQKKGRVWI